jgi:DivIVA domain-containing protein
MTTDADAPVEAGRRLAPGDIQTARFPRGSMIRPGYSDEAVDHFLGRVALEIGRLHAEKAELRDQVHALQARALDAAKPVPPSDQAVRLLATAQQTADSYVAEAEEFSRQMAADARVRHDEQLRHARETAGAMIQAAQEAAARMVADGSAPTEPVAGRSTEELEEQVAYLKAFAQACRVQLRSYLEALLTDVESEWGRADPGALPQATIRAVAQRSDPEVARPANVAREMPMSDSTSEHPVVTAETVVEVLEPRG